MEDDIKEFEELKEKVQEVLKQCEKGEYSLGEIDAAAIKNIEKAESISDVNFLAFQHFERLYYKLTN